jgi:hypothetical protein
MTRARITADVDPDLRRRVKIAAVESDQTLSQWIEEALRDKLLSSRNGDLSSGGRRYIAPGVSLPPEGARPRGSKHPPRLRGVGGTVADAVIEDRR